MRMDHPRVLINSVIFSGENKSLSFLIPLKTGYDFDPGTGERMSWKVASFLPPARVSNERCPKNDVCRILPLAGKLIY